MIMSNFVKGMIDVFYSALMAMNLALVSVQSVQLCNGIVDGME